MLRAGICLDPYYARVRGRVYLVFGETVTDDGTLLFGFECFDSGKDISFYNDACLKMIFVRREDEHTKKRKLFKLIEGSKKAARRTFRDSQGNS